MRRIDIRGNTFIALILLMGSSALAQQDDILLGGKTRPKVTFPHSRHMAGDLWCKDCHHIFENGKNILDESKLVEGDKSIRCSVCHSSKSRLSLEEAFHKMCIGCHRTNQKERKNTGPRYCGECHVRTQA